MTVLSSKPRRPIPQMEPDWEMDDCGGGFYDPEANPVIEDIDEQPTWDSGDLV